MTRDVEVPAPGKLTGDGDVAAPADDSAEDDNVVFDAVITPSRSPCPEAFALLMGTTGAIGGAIGVGFLFSGAWPVIAFFALTMAMLAWAVRASLMRNRAFEHLSLTPSRFSIRRVDTRGRVEEIELQPYWLRVEFEGTDHAEELSLRTHGVAHPVGLWLTPTERLELALALKEALTTLRSPRMFGSDPQES